MAQGCWKATRRRVGADGETDPTLAKSSAEALSPGFVDLSGAVGVPADKSSAEEKLALKTIMDVRCRASRFRWLVNDYNKVINDVVASATDAADKSKGFGDALVGLNGAVNTVLPNGSELFDQITKIRDERRLGRPLDQAIQTGTPRRRSRRLAMRCPARTKPWIRWLRSTA